MLKAIARIQTAYAIAKANGDGAAMTTFGSAATALTPYAEDPYILPDVLTPADVAPLMPTTIAEAHDAVQAGLITRQDAVDANIIQSINQLPPHPDKDASAATDPSVPLPPGNAVIPPSDAPANSVPEQVTPPPSDVPAVAVGGTDSVAEPVNQSDTGDEDPTPPEKETIASEDKRIDAIEDKLGMRTGKVSRQ